MLKSSPRPYALAASSLQQFLHIRHDHPGPDFAAFCVRVQQVGHNFPRQRAVGGEELRIDVQEKHWLPVRKLADCRLFAGRGRYRLPRR